MKIKLTFQYVLTFLALTFMMHEAHEIVHTSVGRLICGCWGQRDFNVWGLCDSCETNPYGIFSTIAGPVFTFVMIWFGSFLLDNNNQNQKALGFSLIFANMPFGRILNPIFGGGDEVVVADTFIDNWDLSRIIVLILIILIVAFPLIKAYRLIENRHKIGWFLMFLLLPFIFDILIVLLGMNTLLAMGVLSKNWIFGSPVLVTVWTITVTLIFVLTRKNIFKLIAK
ncbi:MAG: hypothetical protein IM638_00830 [Bacteroidetes bacterium]|nr:hypothetical protein [Bacteroidota bacterium]